MGGFNGSFNRGGMMGTNMRGGGMGGRGGRGGMGMNNMGGMGMPMPMANNMMGMGGGGMMGGMGGNMAMMGGMGTSSRPSSRLSRHLHKGVVVMKAH